MPEGKEEVAEAWGRLLSNSLSVDVIVCVLFTRTGVFFFFCFCFYRDIFCLCFVVVVFFNQKLLLVTPRFLKVTILFFLNVPDLFQLLAQTTSLEQSSTRASGFPPRRIHL